MAAEKKAAEAKPPVATESHREESDTAAPAKKAAPAKRSKKPPWVARAHRARGVK